MKPFAQGNRSQTMLLNRFRTVVSDRCDSTASANSNEQYEGDSVANGCLV